MWNVQAHMHHAFCAAFSCYFTASVCLTCHNLNMLLFCNLTLAHSHCLHCIVHTYTGWCMLARVIHLVYDHIHVCIHLCIQLPGAICVPVISALSQGVKLFIHCGTLVPTGHIAQMPYTIYIVFLLPLGHNICLVTHSWVQPLSGILLCLCV